MIARRALGRQISGDNAARLGRNPREKYRPCMAVLAVGSSNSPDIAQAAHEYILQQDGCLHPSVTLRYRDPLPAGDTYEGVYLEDHMVVNVCPCVSVFSNSGPDLDLIERAHRAYQHHRVARPVGKAFGFSVEREKLMWFLSFGAPSSTASRATRGPRFVRV